MHFNIFMSAFILLVIDIRVVSSLRFLGKYHYAGHVFLVDANTHLGFPGGSVLKNSPAASTVKN